MMRRHAWLLLLVAPLLSGEAVLGQERDIEPPLAGRPVDFSHLAGRWRLTVDAQPTEVFVEEPLLLKVRITGQGPERLRPERKNLHLFPEGFAEQFLVEPLADEDQVRTEDNTWEFVYRLRPRSSQVDAIPSLRLVYYLVSPNRRGYQTTYSDPVPIVVKSKPPVEPRSLGLTVVEAPERLYHLAGSEAVLAREELRSLWTPGIVGGLILVPPLLAIVWVVTWRRIFPDDVGRVERRRSRAARRALRELQGDAGRGRRCSRPNVEILTTYLRERLDFPTVEATPAEVGRFLRRRGAARPIQQVWTRFYQSSDEARFAPAYPAPDDAAAAHLIDVLEGDPCLAR